MSANRCAACDTRLDGRGDYMTADGMHWCDKHIGDAPKYAAGNYALLRATRDVERGQIVTTADVTPAPKREPRVGDVWRAAGSGAAWKLTSRPDAARMCHAYVVSSGESSLPPGFTTDRLTVFGDVERGNPYNFWTLVTPAPEALPPSAGRDFLAAVHAQAAERFAPQPEAPRSEPADWRDAYPVGTECEVNAGSWGGNGWHLTRVVDWEGTGCLVVEAVDGCGARGKMSSAFESNFRPLRTEPARETTFTIAQDFRHAKDAARRIDEAGPDPFVPVMHAAPFHPMFVTFGPGTPAAGIRACPFCTHALHTAHTSAVLRCAACGWAGTEAQRAAACEPVRAEPRFKVGQWVRPRVVAWSKDGTQIHHSVTLQVMAVDGGDVDAVIQNNTMGAPEGRYVLSAGDLVLAERPA